MGLYVTANMVVHGVKEYGQIIFPGDITSPLNVEKFHLQKRVREDEIGRLRQKRKIQRTELDTRIIRTALPNIVGNKSSHRWQKRTRERY